MRYFRCGDNWSVPHAVGFRRQQDARDGCERGQRGGRLLQAAGHWGDRPTDRRRLRTARRPTHQDHQARARCVQLT